MPRNRKYFPNKSVLFVTTRTEVGLPLVPSLPMNFILWGILARASEMFDVKVCHFVFMSNHFHMLLVVQSPEDVSRFMGYVKTESAHAVNRLLGRRQRTIWLDGYDSPLLLTAEDVSKYIRYIYLNPARANLEEHIERFPGVSSWHMFVNGNYSQNYKRLSRSSLIRHPNPSLSMNKQHELVENLKKLPGSEHTFRLEPNAWMKCFPELNETPVELINANLVTEIKREEAQMIRARVRDNKKVIGEIALRKQSMLKERTPQKNSPRMICLCGHKELRAQFLKNFRHLCEQAKEVYKNWRRGDVRKKIPPGLFAPRIPPLTSAICV